MSTLLTQYFNQLKKVAYDQELHYFQYSRETDDLPFSVHLKLRYDQARTYDSWGNGLSKDEAFGKALMELIERYTFASISPFDYKHLFGIHFRKKSLHDISQEYNLPIIHLHPSNSNGVAIHTNKKRALESALAELIERHTILYCIVKNISPHGSVQLSLSQNKVCTFYFWKSSLDTYVVVGAYKKKDGWYFSSGCDPIRSKAIQKAVLEINSFLCLAEDNLKIENFEIHKNDIDSFNRYYRYSGDDRIIHFLNASSTTRVPELYKKDFYFTQFPQPSIFSDLPKLPCVRVINPYVQQLFFDNWEYSYLNPLLFPKNVELPKFPHIIA